MGQKSGTQKEKKGLRRRRPIRGGRAEKIPDTSQREIEELLKNNNEYNGGMHTQSL